MQPTGNEPPRSATRGRPSKTDAVLLRTRIQDTAFRQFREHGFAGTSIDAIARAAAVSRTTIYALYTDKQTLFFDMIRAAVRASDLSRHVALDDRPPAIVLREAMVTLNRAYYRAPNLEVVRMCIAEADRFPDLMGTVRERLSFSLNDLGAYFARLQAQGRMIIDDCWNATLLFNMMALGSLKPFFIHQDRMREEDMSGHIDLALQIFMRGCFIEADAQVASPAGT